LTWSIGVSRKGRYAVTTEEPRAWESYEQVAGHLLEKTSDMLGLGLETVEGKQKLAGKSGTKWEVDGKGVKTEDGAIVVIECRRWTTEKLAQEDMGAFAYKIGDVGAAGGIVVTPLGVQQGGQTIAKYEGIEIVHLDADSTRTDYVLKFLDKVFLGASARLRVNVGIQASGIVTHPDGSRS
jgi:hypothetical protein